MRESTIEKYLRTKVREEGGECYKWVSPGNPGVPDRIVMFPGNFVFFVETKSDSRSAKLSAVQQLQKRRLKRIGFTVQVLRSKADVDLFMDQAINLVRFSTDFAQFTLNTEVGNA